MPYTPDYTKDDKTLNPKFNPLKRFRTYSYHHVLMVANETNFVIELNKSLGKNLDVYTHPDLKGNGERFSVQTLGSSKLEYVVLYNSMTDSNFIIDNLEYKTFVGGGNMDEPEGEMLTNVMGNSLMMTIREPFGSRFVEFILAACNALRVHQSQAIFVLKTIFVGHKDDGSIEPLTNYHAYPFFLLNVGFSFSSSGTTYNIEAAPFTNGVAALPVFSTIGGSSFTIEGFTLKNFVDAFNRKLEEIRAISQKKLEETNSNDTVTKYSIVIEGENYETYEIDIRKMNMSNGKQWTYTVPQGATIDSTLKYILAQCPKILEEQKPTPDKYVNDIAVVHSPLIRSKVIQTKKEDGKIYTEYVYRITKREQHVVKHKGIIEKQIKESSLVAAARATEGNTKKVFEQFLEKQLKLGNLTEFDYMFSGKNDDVINFDMLFEFGLGAMENAMMPTQPLSQEEQTTPQPTGGVVKTTASANPDVGQRLYLPYTYSTPLKKPEAYDQFQRLLRRYSTFETWSAQIEVMGNPILFAECTQDNYSPPKDVRNNNGKNIFPLFVKINVFMPQIDPKTGFVDFKNGNYEPERGFKHPFWNDGIFTIHEIYNKFSGGKFTQTLVLLQMVVDGSTAQTYVTESEYVAPVGGTIEERTEEQTRSSFGKNQNITKSTRCNGPKYELTSSQQMVSSNNSSFYEGLRYIEGGSGGGALAYTARNGSFYGAYQMGYPALVDAGLMEKTFLGSGSGYKWKDSNPFNIRTTQDFLNNPKAQDYAVMQYHKKLWKYLKPVHSYIGKTIGGLQITASGMIAAAHLVGHSNVIKFLKSSGKIVAIDGNCIPLTHYMYCLGNKDVSMITESSVGKKLPITLQKFDLRGSGITFVDAS